MPDKSIWENQYDEAEDRWAAQTGSSMSEIFRQATESTSARPPTAKFYCTAAQWDEAAAYRDLPPEQKAATEAPALALLLGWGPSPSTATGG